MNILILITYNNNNKKSSIELPKNKTTPFNNLTNNEITQVYETYTSKTYNITIQNKNNTYMMNKIITTIFTKINKKFDNPSKMNSQNLYEITYDKYITSNTNLNNNNSNNNCTSTTTNTTSYEIPIKKIETYYNNILSQTQQTFQTFKNLSCSNINNNNPPSNTSPINKKYPTSYNNLKSQYPMFIPN